MGLLSRAKVRDERLVARRSSHFFKLMALTAAECRGVRRLHRSTSMARPTGAEPDTGFER